MKKLIQKIKNIFRRAPQFPAHTWKVRDALSIKVQDAQYEQARNRILGIQ